MLKMDGTRPTVVPTTTLSCVALGASAPTSARFLDSQDEATVRAFATRSRRQTRPQTVRSDLPSYQRMKAHGSWRHTALGGQPGRKVFAGLPLVLMATAFSAGMLAQWTLGV
ncbi:hypothetical protein DX908_00040 [Parvularcula marina]|uniref:Uncharacterized protein n=1 Tax=Parvularcula marina TaxID=2292771 RepID=A0A371RED5_9PROT|nr:hypothetical protein DX908_00040 [Parvularcula marina]